MSELIFEKLSAMKRPELTEYVKANRLQKAVPGYSSMRKVDLVNKLQQHIKVRGEDKPKEVVVEYKLEQPVQTPKPAIDDIVLELEKVKVERDAARALLEQMAAYSHKQAPRQSDSDSDC
jgi:hypothetical protein